MTIKIFIIRTQKIISLIGIGENIYQAYRGQSKSGDSMETSMTEVLWRVRVDHLGWCHFVGRETNINLLYLDLELRSVMKKVVS